MSANCPKRGGAGSARPTSASTSSATAATRTTRAGCKRIHWQSVFGTAGCRSTASRPGRPSGCGNGPVSSRRTSRPADGRKVVRPQHPGAVWRSHPTRSLSHLLRDNPMSRVRFAALVGLSVLAGPAAAADLPALTVEVDARELPRRLVHTTLDIPCQPGPLRLWYPKWFPGSHGPHGRVEDVAGFRVETSEGTPVPWTRDEVELHCVVIQVPEGRGSIRVKLDTVCESAGPDRAGIHTVGTGDVAVINWNTCLVYPQGPTADDQPVKLRLRLPDGWKYATALKAEPDKDKDGVATFRPVSLTT